MPFPVNILVQPKRRKLSISHPWDRTLLLLLIALCVACCWAAIHCCALKGLLVLRYNPRTSRMSGENVQRCETRRVCHIHTGERCRGICIQQSSRVSFSPEGSNGNEVLEQFWQGLRAPSDLPTVACVNNMWNWTYFLNGRPNCLIAAFLCCVCSGMALSCHAGWGFAGWMVPDPGQ